MGLSGTELRRLVSRLRRKGVPIASSRTGYWYAATAMEVYTTIRQLRQMADGLEKAIAGLESALEQFGEAGA
jgi:dihydrodipicolinate synthase/N-acetylneuraminate lyase